MRVQHEIDTEQHAEAIVKEFLEHASADDRALATMHYEQLFQWLSQLAPTDVCPFTDEQLQDAASAHQLDPAAFRAAVMQMCRARFFGVQALTFIPSPARDVLTPALAGFFCDQRMVYARVWGDHSTYFTIGYVDHDAKVFIPKTLSNAVVWSRPWYIAYAAAVRPPFAAHEHPDAEMVLADLEPDVADRHACRRACDDLLAYAQGFVPEHALKLRLFLECDDETCDDALRQTTAQLGEVDLKPETADALRHALLLVRCRTFRLDARMKQVERAHPEYGQHSEHVPILALYGTAIRYCRDVTRRFAQLMRQSHVSDGASKLNHETACTLANLMFQIKTLLASPAYIVYDLLSTLTRAHGILRESFVYDAASDRSGEHLRHLACEAYNRWMAAYAADLASASLAVHHAARVDGSNTVHASPQSG